MAELHHPQLSVSRQAELLDVPRSNLYYRLASSKKLDKKKEEDKKLKKLIKEIHGKYIFYGHRRIKNELRKKGYKVNNKRVIRLMKEEGIRAVYPKPKTTISNKQHKRFPYLLREKTISKVNEVWSSDITYIRVKGGWIYLTVIMDWYSRYVISWEI